LSASLILWQERNRRVPGLRSPLALVPESVLIPAEIDGVVVYMHPPAPGEQRRPGPENPSWKIPHSCWSDVLQRVARGETLRFIASQYGVSYEAVRRVIQAAREEGL
jgi:hypothetical protein